ncbi:MAG: DUF488 domain-containing protein [Humibacillus sp.]|nr:DUF488 domain-containing protein [Humibacillus sp.]MDN5775723.1 DUF488 domain-containing protein [Humibacillus sp.]
MISVWTIGHWTRPEPIFLQLLAAQQINLVADIRAHPGSRSSPQYGRDVMPGWLEPAGIGYAHLEQLGGRRRKQPDAGECNEGWKNASFRNYADYTRTPTYEQGLERLAALAATSRVVLMCAEPTPWRCHRLPVANTLLARGWSVEHIIGEGQPTPHRLGQWGATPSVDAERQVTYPAQG